MRRISTSLALRFSGTFVVRLLTSTPCDQLRLLLLPISSHSPFQDVVGEEEDVACRLVEIVGAEALIDLGREDFFPFVELHRDLHYGVGVDCLRVERGTYPLSGGLFGDELSPHFCSRDGSKPSSPPHVGISLPQADLRRIPSRRSSQNSPSRHLGEALSRCRTHRNSDTSVRRSMAEDLPTPPAVPCNHLQHANAEDEALG